MPFYHATSTLLQPQSVILPGNWGRVVRKFGHKHNLAMRESVLEHIRDSEFGQLPSRLDCAFAFDALDEAVYYVQDGGREPMVVYEVEPVNEAAVRHATDMRRVDGNGPVGFDWAREYWNGNFLPALNGRTFREILVNSPLRVIQLAHQ